MSSIYTAHEDLDVESGKKLICELMTKFYANGWVTGTGGGITLKVNDTILMAPSSVQKEYLCPENIFELDTNGDIKKEGYISGSNDNDKKKLKLSQCHPLFMSAYDVATISDKKNSVNAVLHHHSINSILVTFLFDKHVNITGLEMIKGIIGHENTDCLSIPIILNTPSESQLNERLANAIKLNPKSAAVLVKGHGIYIWGPSWDKVKTQAECYEHLFETIVRLYQLNLYPNSMFNIKPNLKEFPVSLQDNNNNDNKDATVVGEKRNFAQCQNSNDNNDEQPPCKKLHLGH